MNRFRLVFAFLVSLGVTVSAHAGPFDDSVSAGDGWFESPWLGWYHEKANTSWMYHQELGWMYYQGSAASSMWFWRADTGWFWTSNNRFPYLWNREQGWLYYYQDYKETPYFYSYRKFRWFQAVEEINDGSPSFFPLTASFTGKMPSVLTWTYQVNKGQPLYYYSDGVGFYFKFNQMTLTFNRNSGELTTSLNGSLSGSASGNFSGEQKVYLMNGQDGIYKTKETMKVTMGLYAQGRYIQVKLDGLVDQFSKSSPFILDRNDWDTMEVGSIISGKGATTANIDILLSATGVSVPSERIQETIDYSQNVEVIAHYTQYKVGSRTYQNVVHLRDWVYAFDVDGNVSSQQADYFLAEGVGIILSTNFGDIMGAGIDFDIELISKNF